MWVQYLAERQDFVQILTRPAEPTGGIWTLEVKIMVFVLDSKKKPLAPCHEARARKLLSQGKAKVYKREPFSIILKHEIKEKVQPFTVKIDPGSRHTGLCIIQGDRVGWMGQIEHRTDIQMKLEKRAAYRRRRRSKNLRYREVRYNNRKKPKGWFPPTIMSRVQNIVTIVLRLMKLCPIANIEYELVNFDTQLMLNPDIKGKEYQEGPLYRTEIRTFLLSTYKGICQYCGGETKDSQMEWEHIHPKSRGGSNSLRNATLACHCCNETKDNLTLSEWKTQIKEKGKLSKLDESRLEGIERVEKQNYSKSLADAAITNAIHWKIKDALETETHLPVRPYSSRHTKFNRVEKNLPKEHCIDAACVGKDLPEKLYFKTKDCLVINACGRGLHCRTRVDRNGFPRGKYLPRQKDFFGFQTGNLVAANIPKGSRQGKYVGRVACRTSGKFNISTVNGCIQSVHHKYMHLIQLNDGYGYQHRTVL